MNRFVRVSGFLVALLSSPLAVGCGKDDPPTAPPTGQAPDFALFDVNPNSANLGQAVSPRNYLQSVSAWYFGHAT